jgi:hypothetical protein
VRDAHRADPVDCDDVVTHQKLAALCRGLAWHEPFNDHLCMYVCVCVCVCVCVHLCVRVRVCAYVRAWCVRVCARVCVHVNTPKNNQPRRRKEHNNAKTHLLLCSIDNTT